MKVYLRIAIKINKESNENNFGDVVITNLY